ncbi:MAG: photosystem II stability/assembly factor-like uncharacterized protein [Candidatus Azotimanducaceae bacterium]|jgi:photosystem II stability/assembly factor-like uncharacterized protein
MALHRHFLLILVATLGATPASAQSTQIAAIDENYRALVETSSRVLGLDYASEVFVSENGGQSFTPLSTLSSDPKDTYYSMASLGNTVIAVGTDGLIARSANEASSWTASVNTDFFFGNLRTVAGRPNTTNTWISAGGDGSEGVILRSADDGATWTKLTGISDLSFSGSVWTESAWLVCGLDDLSFEGVMYRSTDDGLTWSPVTLPNAIAPLRGLATDGAGNVIAVGESGTVLYSSNHGQTFVQSGAGLLSEDLLVAVAVGTNEFVVGGNGKSLLQTQGASLSIIREPVGGAPEVESLLFVDGTVLVGGEFSSEIKRSLPFSLNIIEVGSSFQLSIDQILSGKTYTLQTSTDLEDWVPVANSSLAGLGGPLVWVQSKNGPRRFWRVEEY